jgi:arylsulfatase
MNKGIVYATILSGSVLGGCKQAIETPPNIIVILTDDQGYGDFSCHGNPILSTPQSDKLYQESVRFTNFHVAPVCTPTRGQLMTGMDAMKNKACMVPSGRNLMRRDIQTLPEVFLAHGYQTGIFGKWHLGDSYPDRPMDRGFVKSVWHQGWGLPSEIEYDNDYYKTRYLDSLTTVFSDTYCTDLWFRQAIAWMDKMHREGQPFLTYLATNTPHGPLYAPKEDSAFYGGKVNGQQAMFFGMIRNFEKNLEILDQWLTDKGLKDNTILVLMNDNGGTTGVPIFNAGMQGKKGSHYEGGHRAACFIRWPGGNLAKDVSTDYPATIQDIFPTLMDLAGLEPEKITQLDGISLKPLLLGKEMKEEERMFVVQYGGRIYPEKFDACVVLNNWRLVGENELYDITSDPGQQKNLADSFPEILNKMRSYYEKWWAGVAPGIDSIVPVIVGNPLSNPTTITSNNWVGADADNQKMVALAVGPPRGGTMHIFAESAGRYRFELSRWPFHLNRPMHLEGPATTIGGNPLETGKAIAVEKGCISVNGGEPVVASRLSADAASVSVEAFLEAGESVLNAWFRDVQDKDLCGANYIKVYRLP